jgi:hypothetical protein
LTLCTIQWMHYTNNPIGRHIILYSWQGLSHMIRNEVFSGLPCHDISVKGSKWEIHWIRFVLYFEPSMHPICFTNPWKSKFINSSIYVKLLTEYWPFFRQNRFLREAHLKNYTQYWFLWDIADLHLYK